MIPTAIRSHAPLGLVLALGLSTLGMHHRRPAIAPATPPAVRVEEPVAIELRAATSEREPPAPPPRRSVHRRMACSSGPYAWMACTITPAGAVSCTTEYGPIGASELVWHGDAFHERDVDPLGCEPAVHTTREHHGDTTCVDRTAVSQRNLQLCAGEVVETLCVSDERGVVGFRLDAPGPPFGEIRCGEVPAAAFPPIRRR